MTHLKNVARASEAATGEVGVLSAFPLLSLV
jgi:hypothetical protein